MERSNDGMIEDDIILWYDVGIVHNTTQPHLDARYNHEFYSLQWLGSDALRTQQLQTRI